MSDVSTLQDWVNRRFLLIAMSILFVVVAFYGHPNLGDHHLALPFNLNGWLVIAWIVVLGILKIIRTQKFYYSDLSLYFVSFPVIIILISVVTKVIMPVEWMFRLLYIIGGLCFLFALFQFSLKQKDIDNILLILIISVGLQAVIGVMQTMSINAFNWLPYNPDTTPRGIFQQVNVLSSFLATGLCICLYFISRPSFKNSSMIIKVLVFFSFVLSVYVLAASGSRAGIFSMILSVPLVLWVRYKQLRKHKLLLVVMTTFSMVMIYVGEVGQVGLESVIEKTADISSGARFSMYAIGLELVENHPFSGHGIGGFLKAWNVQSSAYIADHPNVYLPLTTTHPHNEILLWMIEAGVVALMGILAVVLGILKSIYRCGFNRGGAYFAMLLPISFHAQVEHPFYASSLHWCLWLFIIFLALRHRGAIKKLGFSKMTNKIVQVSSILLGVAVTFFVVGTMKAETNLYNFLYNPEAATQPYLQFALSNIYTHDRAEKVAMRSSLYANIENSDIEQVARFEKWALGYVDMRPELKMYEDLISASVFLRPNGRGCDAIGSALSMYAHNQPLKQAFNERCTEK